MPALCFTALLHGLRPGIDRDHVAAIADLTSSQQGRRQGLAVASAYAAGHGLVVFLLGIVAVLAGDVIPAGLDETMSRTVGLTLVLLSISVVAGLVRHRRDHRLRSRWFLLAGAARLRTRFRPQVVEIHHEHPHDHDGHDHAHDQLKLTANHAHTGERAATAVGHSHRLNFPSTSRSPSSARGRASSSGWCTSLATPSRHFSEADAEVPAGSGGLVVDQGQGQCVHPR